MSVKYSTSIRLIDVSVRTLFGWLGQIVVAYSAKSETSIRSYLWQNSYSISSRFMTDYRLSAVFSAFQPLLRILTVYKWENFQAPRSHRSRNVCRAAVVSLFAFSSIVLILSDAWHCYSRQFDFRESALPIAILFSAPALAIAYISVGMKGGMINEVIDHLNEIVSKRKAFTRTYHCNKRDSHSIGANNRSIWRCGYTLCRLRVHPNQILFVESHTIIQCFGLGSSVLSDLRPPATAALEPAARFQVSSHHAIV